LAPSNLLKTQILLKTYEKNFYIVQNFHQI
jgi:hypothetical protein